jgi:hypothetical protein
MRGQYPKEFREGAVRLMAEPLDEHNTQWSAIRHGNPGLISSIFAGHYPREFKIAIEVISGQLTTY